MGKRRTREGEAKNEAGEEYEQYRAQRIKDNLDRMNKLGLLHLSKKVKPKSSKPVSQKKQPSSPTRRSSRQKTPKCSKCNSLQGQFCGDCLYMRSTKGGKLKADSRKADNKKMEEDLNKPKRPSTSAFFIFLEQFREDYKEKHPENKSVAAVGKAAGDRWKSMSDKEKATYVAMAEQRKEEYVRQMEAYNKKMEEESDKSKSEVNDEDEDEE